MSLVTLVTSEPADDQWATTEAPEVAFERRWKAWQARGLAHDRVVRRRLLIMAVVTGLIAVAALGVFGLLFS